MLVFTYIILLSLQCFSVAPANAGWPPEIVNIPAQDFYDCLYIFYICTDAVDSWPKNKNLCSKLYEECEKKLPSTVEVGSEVSSTSSPQLSSTSAKPSQRPTQSTTAQSTLASTTESTTQPTVTESTTKTTESTTTITESTTKITESTTIITESTTTTTESTTTTAESTTTTTESTTTTTESTTTTTAEPTTTSTESTTQPLIVPPSLEVTPSGNVVTTTATSTTSTTEDINADVIQITDEGTDSIDNQNSSTLATLPIKVTSCLDLRESGNTRSGIYDITFGDKKQSVFCDMATLGGGWTVIQRRGDFGNPPDFFLRNWTEYRNGFGRPDKELWVGLEPMFYLTNVESQQLLINLEDFEGNRTAVLVNEFRIANEDNGYRIFYKNFSSPLGKSLPARGTKFSTIDRDNDAWSKNCAERFSGAWWYSACHNSNLNGLYLRGEHESFGDGVNWYHWKGYHYSLKLTVLKIRGIRKSKKKKRSVFLNHLEE